MKTLKNLFFPTIWLLIYTGIFFIDLLYSHVYFLSFIAGIGYALYIPILSKRIKEI